jgi:predicted phage terminase large subunit-like protein
MGYQQTARFHDEIYFFLQPENNPEHFSPLQWHPKAQKQFHLEAPRKHAKSECISINYVSWLIGNYPDIRILIVSKTADLAESTVAAIKRRIESDQKYINIFGNLKPKNPQKWTDSEFFVERKTISKFPTIRGVGLLGANTGYGYDLIIPDDVIDEENVRTINQIQKASQWFFEVLLTTLFPWGATLALGTRWHYADLYSELITPISQGGKAWPYKIYKAIEQFPDPEKGIPAKVLWPEVWSYEALMRKKDQIGSIFFNCQYQNDPTSMEGSLLKSAWLHSWDETNTDSLGRSNYKPPNFDNMRHYFGVDPSLGENDYFGIAVLAYDPVKNQGYLREVWAEHLDLPTIIKTVFAQKVQLYKPLKIYMEANFWQKLLNKLPELQGYPITPINTVKNKEERFIPMSSHFESKRVLVNPLLLNKSEFWTQWVQFPRGQHDDAVDCVEMVVSKVVGAGPKANPSFKLY